MQRQRVVGICEACDCAAQQLALDVEQRHAPALGKEAFGCREPNASRGAGDECDF